MSGDEARRQAGARGVRNTVVRSVAELVGKFSTLAVLAVLARSKGQEDVGALVAAMAFLVLATMPIDLGMDRYLLRRISADRRNYPEMVSDVLAAKFAIAIPTIPITLLLLYVVGFDVDTRVTALLLLPSFLMDAVTRTLHYTFTAVEQAQHLAASVLWQKIIAAVIGLAALAAGYGVRAVAIGMMIGSAAGLIVGVQRARRGLGTFSLRSHRGGRGSLIRDSAGFAAQDVFTSLLFRVDALLLTFMTSAATVGRYGGAYRLLESTLFISFSISGAFSPMYTYLGHDTNPAVGAIFARSVKLALVALMPVAVVFVLRADETSDVFFGSGFGAGPSLALLGPVVVLLAVATLSSSLTVSRSNPRVMVKLTAGATVINVGLNLALIPSHGASGAAAAMLVTSMFTAVGGLLIAAPLAGGFPWLKTMAGPLAAGLAMTGACLALPASLLVTVPVATAAYLVMLTLIERLVSPADLDFAIDLLRRRLSVTSA